MMSFPADRGPGQASLWAADFELLRSREGAAIEVLVVDGHQPTTDRFVARLSAYEEKSSCTTTDLASAVDVLSNGTFDMVVVVDDAAGDRAVPVVHNLRGIDEDMPIVVVSCQPSHDAIERAGADFVFDRGDLDNPNFVPGVMYFFERARRRARGDQVHKLLETDPDAVIIFGWSGEVLWANKAGHELFGALEGWDALLTSIPVLRPGEPGVDVTIPGKTEGETRTVHVRATGLDWKGERATYATFTDVTATCRIQRELQRFGEIALLGRCTASAVNGLLAGPLRRMTRQVEQSRAMAANAPGMTGHALTQRLAFAETLGRCITGVVAGLEPLCQDDPVPTEVDVGEVVASSVHTARLILGDTASFELALGRTPPICAHRASLSQALVTFILRAANAGERGGDSLLVRTRLDHKRQIRVDLISRNLRHRNWMSILRTSPTEQHWGARLGLAQQVIRDLGGQIAVRKQSDAARISLVLPRALALTS